MAKRPDTCASAFENVLVTLGYAPSMANAIASDYKLIVPVALRALGAEGIEKIMSDAQQEFDLHATSDWYKLDGKACAAWAESELDRYREDRLR